jgi:hypothetical protein
MKDVEEQTECSAHRLSGPRSGSAILNEPTGPLGGRRLAKSLGQLADLGFWVAAMAAQGLQKRPTARLQTTANHFPGERDDASRCS